jgi:hypothetical protein
MKPKTKVGSLFPCSAFNGPDFYHTANQMIPKMNHVINDPTKPEHQELIKAAFGTAGLQHTDKIKETIDKIDKANVRTRVPTENLPEGTDAATRWIAPAKGAGGLPHGTAPQTDKGLVADSVVFNKGFYGKFSFQSYLPITANHLSRP